MKKTKLENPGLQGMLILTNLMVLIGLGAAYKAKVDQNMLTFALGALFILTSFYLHWWAHWYIISTKSHGETQAETNVLNSEVETDVLNSEVEFFPSLEEDLRNIIENWYYEYNLKKNGERDSQANSYRKYYIVNLTSHLGVRDAEIASSMGINLSSVSYSKKRYKEILQGDYDKYKLHTVKMREESRLYYLK